MPNYVPLKIRGWFRFLGGRSDITEYPTGRTRALQLGLLVLANVIYNFERMKFAPVLGSIMDYFDVSKIDWANMMTLTYLFYVLAPLIAAPLADRFVGRKNLITWGIFLYCLVSIWQATITSWPLFIVAWVLSTLFVGITYPPLLASTRDYSPRASRGLSFGILTIGWGGGNYLALWFAALVLPHLPTWQGIFLAAAVLGFVIWLLLWALLRDISPAIRHQIIQSAAQKMEVDTRARGMSPKESQATFGRMTTILKSPRIWIMVFALQTWGFTYVVVSFYAPLFFKESLGMTEVEAAASVSWFWPVWTVSVIFWGWFGDKLGIRKLPLVIGCITGAMTLLAVVLMQGQQPSSFQMMLIWIALGLLVGPIWPSWAALYSENLEDISPYAIATGFAVQTLVGDIASLITQFFALRIVEFWGWAALFVAVLVFLLMPPFLIIAAHGPWLPERWKRKAVSVKAD